MHSVFLPFMYNEKYDTFKNVFKIHISSLLKDVLFFIEQIVSYEWTYLDHMTGRKLVYLSDPWLLDTFAHGIN